MAFEPPDYETLRALTHLRADADWRQVCQWLERLQATQDAQNRTLESPALYRGQGAAQLLEYLLGTIHQAPETFRTMQSKHDTGGNPGAW